MCLVLSREASPISKEPKAGFVVVRDSVKLTSGEPNLQRNLQERVSSVLFAFSRAGLFMWPAKGVQEKNSAFSVFA